MPSSTILRHHPSAFLLAAQLLSPMLYPVMDETESGRVLFGAVATFTLLAWAFAYGPVYHQPQTLQFIG